MRQTERQVATNPRRRRKDARPGELIAAALAEFAANGFSRTRLEDVATRASVSKGTIYRYFTDKEALFIAVVRSVATEVLGDVSARIQDLDGSTEDVLRLILHRLYAQLVETDLRSIIQIIIVEGRHYPELVDFYYTEVMTEGRTLLRQLVTRGMARGEIVPSPLTEFPEIIIAPALMAIIWKAIFDRIEPVEAQHFLDAHLELLRNGLIRRA